MARFLNSAAVLRRGDGPFRPILAGGRFSPATLFANSEPGAWYDPSDLSTMFQDRAGTTPVTAPGQSVGLIIDKSQGLVLGSELVTNGDFSAGAAGWSLPAGSSVVDGKLVLNTPVLNVTSVYTTEIGKSYIWSFTVSDYVSGSVQFNFGGATRTIVSGNGTYTGIAVAVTNTTSVRFLNAGAPVASIDNVSVRELPGFHAVANSDAARGSYNVDEAGRGFILFDGADDGYLTSTITPGTDKAQVFAGVRKLSDAATGGLVSTASNPYTTAGSFLITAPDAASATYGFRTTAGGATNTGWTASATAPVTSVLSCVFDASGSSRNTAVFPRINGTVPALSTAGATLTPGTLAAHAMFIGRIGGTVSPFNGRLYSLIVRFGPNLTEDQIAAAEAWVNSKTGAY